MKTMDQVDYEVWVHHEEMGHWEKGWVLAAVGYRFTAAWEVFKNLERHYGRNVRLIKRAPRTLGVGMDPQDREAIEE